MKNIKESCTQSQDLINDTRIRGLNTGLEWANTLFLNTSKVIDTFLIMNFIFKKHAISKIAIATLIRELRDWALKLIVLFFSD